MADVEERHAARALAPQARNVTWAADGTPWQRFLRASSGGRSGRQPIGWTVIRLDAPWQDTPSSERSGWRERVANLADDIAFAVDYTVCTACRLGWVEWPYTMEKYQRCELATAALEAPRLECPGIPWAATSRTPAPPSGRRWVQACRGAARNATPARTYPRVKPRSRRAGGGRSRSLTWPAPQSAARSLRALSHRPARVRAQLLPPPERYCAQLPAEKQSGASAPPTAGRVPVQPAARASGVPHVTAACKSGPPQHSHSVQATCTMTIAMQRPASTA